MVAAAVRMLAEQVPVGGDCRCPGAGCIGGVACPKAVGLGLAVGFLTGLFGAADL